MPPSKDALRLLLTEPKESWAGITAPITRLTTPLRFSGRHMRELLVKSLRKKAFTRKSMLTATLNPGTVDGLVRLVKLLLSPLLDVTLVAEAFGTWKYRMGYYSGVLTFAGHGSGGRSLRGCATGEVRWG